MTVPATAKMLAATTAAVILAATPAAASGPPDQRLHQVTTSPAQGTFSCGDLRLTINAGTETEVFDGTLRDGVTRITIHRTWHHVTLAGSDGQTYRGQATTRAQFVLVAPDTDNPVSGHEIIKIRFLGGPSGSPGSLHEEFSIRNSVKSEPVITGGCDYAQ